MSDKHGILSVQEINLLQGGDMILNGLDNDEIVLALGVSLSSVRNKTTYIAGGAGLAVGAVLARRKKD
jgi:hypothetical protein